MKILLGISGGLDSAFAAVKLIEEGHQVEGAVLIMHGYTEIDAAEEVARSVGIKLHKINCEDSFEKCVVTDFIDSYTNGKTPNPCIVCNSDVKFRKLYDYAMENGFDRIATGHYANVVSVESAEGVRYAIKRSMDDKKDQTYMLWRLPQEILSKLVFPLFDQNKVSVREKAREIGLVAADRAESQEICFIPDSDHARYIEERVGKSPSGNFIDEDGKILGEHKGIIRYTVGQRKGLGIALGQRVFVTNIDAKNNTVTLSKEDKTSDVLEVCGMVFSGISEPKKGEILELTAKVRYLSPMVLSTLEYLGNGCAKVHLSIPQRAVTPGQSAVFYVDSVLVAGGFIN